MWFEGMHEEPTMVALAKVEVAVGMLLKERHRTDLKDLPNVSSLKPFATGCKTADHGGWKTADHGRWKEKG